MIVNRKGVTVTREDTWSLDGTLAPIIAASLRKFLEVISDPKCVAGCPDAIMSELYGSDGYSDWDAAQEKRLEDAMVVWHYRLRLMIRAFELCDSTYVNPHEVDYCNGLKFDSKPYEGDIMSHELIQIAKPAAGITMLYHLTEAMDAIVIHEGLRYFAKHYNSLWW